jgi:hypothetical protein
MRRLGALLIPAAATAAVPTTLHQQGRLLGATGQPLSGSVDLTFTVRSDATFQDVAPADGEDDDGPGLFSVTLTAVPLDDGYFSVELPLGAAAATVFDGSGPRYLATRVGSGPEIGPRSTLVSVPYATRAGAVDHAASIGSAAPCTSANAGAFDYQPGGALRLCDGTAWLRVSTPSPAWQASAYTWRTRFRLSPSTEAGAGFAIRLLVGQTSAASGVAFHLGGHSQTFPSGRGAAADWAIYDAAGNSLPFWVESVSGGVAAVWVGLVAAPTTAQDLSIYYGRSTTTANQPDAVFDLFDEFATLDTGKWVVSGTASVSGGILTVGDGVLDHDSVASVATFGVSKQMIWQGVIGNETWTYSPYGFDNGTIRLAFEAAWDASNVWAVRNAARTSTSLAKGTNRRWNVQRRADGGLNFLADGSAVSGPSGTDTTVVPIRWHSGAGAGTVDWVIVTDFASDAPTVTTVMAEEAQ